ncbi:unnamed protein product, partial [Laminaria digitata]
RFGPGRLTRRHHQTERLRELRARRSSSGPAHDAAADITPLPLPKTPMVRNRADSQLECNDDDATILASDTKRCRGPSGRTRQLSRQRFEENASPELALERTSTPLAGPTRLSSASEHPRASEHPLVLGEDGSPHDNCDNKGRGRDESGANATTCSSRANVGRGGTRCILDPGSASSIGKPAVRPAETRCVLAPGRASLIASSVLLPVRSAPASRRPRGAKTAVGMSRSMTDTQRDKNITQQCDRSSSNASEENNDGAGIASFSGGGNDTQGEYYGTLPGSDGAPIAPPGSSTDKPGLEYPDIAGACGGIILRLSPVERSLEPWSNVISPLRAMCDIEPSLSRAGLECRGVINAVEAAQEIKSQGRAKRKLARNAKSLLGSDVRPRTSEPRLGIAGVKTELDVMKSILIRERLIVTLRRLIRRLRRHCHKLQDRLRWEATFRRCYGKPPPDEVACATSIAR